MTFTRFTKPIDVLGHEFTHAVTQFTAGLTYQDQSGALNESVSDAFACCLKQRVLGQSVTEADWLIGQGIFLPSVHGTALRSMAQPGTAYDDPMIGKDPQVGSMADFVHTTSDNGGVHTNSGIPNRAFYLAATALGGNSWEHAGPIWYAALTSGISPNTDFAGFAAATVTAAEAVSADAVSAVRGAWEGVGVLGEDRDLAVPELALEAMTHGVLDDRLEAEEGHDDRQHLGRHPERHRANMAMLLEWAQERKIKPYIHGVFPLSETADALRLIEGRKVTGKVIVNPQL